MRALHEAMTPRYKTDASGEVVPDIRAAAAIIFNPANGQVLWEENAQDKRSIASITKVMTTVVFLEDNPDLTQEVTVQRSDVYAASTTFLKANDRLTLGDVLHLTLIASDNAGARVLASVAQDLHKQLGSAVHDLGLVAEVRGRVHITEQLRDRFHAVQSDRGVDLREQPGRAQTRAPGRLLDGDLVWTPAGQHLVAVGRHLACDVQQRAVATDRD